jgi:hypothetical protein
MWVSSHPSDKRPTTSIPPMRRRLQVLQQYFIPKRAFDRARGPARVAKKRGEGDHALIRTLYGVPWMSESARPGHLSYATFNEFSPRAIKPGRGRSRRQTDLPCRWCHRQFGQKWTQAVSCRRKGPTTTCTQLGRGGDEGSRRNSITQLRHAMYLAPKGLHRIHMPWTDAWLGHDSLCRSLFSVNPNDSRGACGLFALQRARRGRIPQRARGRSYSHSSAGDHPS